VKVAKFVLVICLLSIAVMAVLSVTYPELQEGFRVFFAGLGEFAGRLLRFFTEPFRQAFVRG